MSGSSHSSLLSYPTHGEDGRQAIVMVNSLTGARIEPTRVTNALPSSASSFTLPLRYQLAQVSLELTLEPR